MNTHLPLIIKASIHAGQEVLKIYQTDFEITYKADESPLTTADKRANEVIAGYLSQTSIPVLSEEGRDIPYNERKHWKQLWIVDPLDGTKEFIKKNGEFTVNIALVVDQQPVVGVIYAPVLDVIYFGEVGLGAYKIQQASELFDAFDLFSHAEKLPKIEDKDYFGIVASRSHRSDKTNDLIHELEKKHADFRVITKGSSLKLCMIAEGEADLYPRFAPTSEWDIAAGHAIVKATGGRIYQAQIPDKELIYNKEDLLNPWFVAESKSVSQL